MPKIVFEIADTVMLVVAVFVLYLFLDALTGHAASLMIVVIWQWIVTHATALVTLAAAGR